MAEATVLQRAQLDAERQALRGRVSRFRERISEDRSALQDEASRLVGPDSAVGEHPGWLMAGSAAVGFALGVAPMHIPHPDLAPPKAVTGAAGKAATAGIEALKLEAGMVVRDFVAGVLGSDSNGDGASGPSGALQPLTPDPSPNRGSGES